MMKVKHCLGVITQSALIVASVLILAGCQQEQQSASEFSEPLRLLDDSYFLLEAGQGYKPTEYISSERIETREIQGEAAVLLGTAPPGCFTDANSIHSEKPPRLLHQDEEVPQIAKIEELAEANYGWCFSEFRTDKQSYNIRYGKETEINIYMKLSCERVELVFSSVSRDVEVMVKVPGNSQGILKASGKLSIVVPSGMFDDGENAISLVARGGEEGRLAAKLIAVNIGEAGKLYIKKPANRQRESFAEYYLSYNYVDPVYARIVEVVRQSRALRKENFPLESPIFKARLFNESGTHDCTKRAIALAPGSSFGTSLKIPAQSPFISFSYGFEDGRKSKYAALSIDVIAKDGTKMIHLIPIDAGPKRWVDVAIDLSNVSGKEASLSFSYHGPQAKSENGVFIGEPVITSKASKHKDSRKNVLLISLDTFRADRISLLGHTRETTPALDAMAETGRVFSDAYATTSWTLPSHKAMLTGFHHLYLNSLSGKVSDKTRLTSLIPSLPTYFKQAGYRTYAIVGSGFVSPEYGFERDFDEYHGYRYNYGREVSYENGTRISKNQGWEVIDSILERNGDGNPWFMFLHTYNPHIPYATLGYGHLWDDGEHAGEEYSPDLKRGFQDPQPADMIAHVDKVYDRNIRRSDDELSAFIRKMRVKGLLENTIVLITSDHGEQLGEHERLADHSDVWQSVIHIPMIVMGPGIDESVVGRRVSLLDVTPTLLDMAGLDKPDYLPGHSLLSESTDEKAFLAAYIKGSEPQFALLKGAYKYHLHANERYLFDLDTDPFEQRPLDINTEQTAAIAQKMHDELLIRSAEEIPGWNIYFPEIENNRIRISIESDDLSVIPEHKADLARLGKGKMAFNMPRIEHDEGYLLSVLEMPVDHVFSIRIEEWDESQQAWGEYSGFASFNGMDQKEFSGEVLVDVDSANSGQSIEGLISSCRQADVLVWYTEKPFTSSGFSNTDSLSDEDVEALRNLGYLQ